MDTPRYSTSAGSFHHRDGDQDRPTKALLSELVGEAQKLMREEVALAKAEIREDVSAAVKSGRDVGIGGVVAHTGMLALVACVILLLATFMPAWVSALIVGVVLAGVGAVLANKGVKQAKRIRPTQKTAESMQENKTWLKQTARELRSTARASA